MSNFRIFKYVISASLMLFFCNPSFAGDEAEIRNEISFLANKLLDINGQKELTIKQPSVFKPFLGICGEVGHSGVLLTCVTPGHSAYKSGLQTGDIVTSINGVSMLDKSTRSKKHNDTAYMKMMNSMKEGQVLKFVLSRQGEERNIDINVGTLIQPSYTLIIKRE